MRVRQTDAEREMHYIDLFTHRPPVRFLLDEALMKSPAKFIFICTSIKVRNLLVSLTMLMKTSMEFFCGPFSL